MEFSWLDFHKMKKNKKNKQRLTFLLTMLCLLLALNGCTNDIYRMNKNINSYKYITSDIAKNSLKEPAEFYTDGGGICNDFANVKRAELLKMGYKDSDIKFIIQPAANIEKSNYAHTLLQVNNLVLDNQNNTLTPAFMVPGYRITYAQLKIIVAHNDL